MPGCGRVEHVGTAGPWNELQRFQPKHMVSTNVTTLLVPSLGWLHVR
jgi:hypothetical protein